MGQIDSRHIIVSGGDDRTVRMWDLAKRTAIGEPFKQHEDWVLAVGIGSMQGRPVILSAGKDRVLRIWSSSGKLADENRYRFQSQWYGRIRVHRCSGHIDGLVALRLNRNLSWSVARETGPIPTEGSVTASVSHLASQQSGKRSPSGGIIRQRSLAFDTSRPSRRNDNHSRAGNIADARFCRDAVCRT